MRIRAIVFACASLVSLEAIANEHVPPPVDASASVEEEPLRTDVDSPEPPPDPVGDSDDAPTERVYATEPGHDNVHAPARPQAGGRPPAGRTTDEPDDWDAALEPPPPKDTTKRGIVESGFELSVGSAAFLPGLHKDINESTYDDRHLGGGVYFRLGHLSCIESTKQVWRGYDLPTVTRVLDPCPLAFEISVAYTRSLFHPGLPAEVSGGRLWALDLFGHFPLSRQGRTWAIAGLDFGKYSNAIGFGLVLGLRTYLLPMLALQADVEGFAGFGENRRYVTSRRVGTAGPLDVYEPVPQEPRPQNFGGLLARAGVVVRY